MNVIKPPKDDWKRFLKLMNLPPNLDKDDPAFLSIFEDYKSLKYTEKKIVETMYRRHKRWLIGHKIVLCMAATAIIMLLLGISAHIKNFNWVMFIIGCCAFALNIFNIVIQTLAIRRSKSEIRKYELSHQIMKITKFKTIWG